MAKYGTFYVLRTYFWFFIAVNVETMANILTNLKLYCRKRAQLPSSLTGKTIVITGANAGIGKECAKTCLRLGAKVIIACRDQTKAKSAMVEIVNEAGQDKKANLDLVELDLSSLASVRLAAKAINSKVTQIDVLLNNAGVMMCPEWKTKDNYEYQLGTNHLGHFLLTNLLISKLKAAPSARIVNLSSLAHLMGQINFENLSLTGEYSPAKSYAQSKLANQLFTIELYKRLKKSNINVYSVHPGVVQTELGRHFSEFAQKFVKPMTKLTSITADLGAQTSLHCALSEDTANQSGFYYA